MSIIVFLRVDNIGTNEKWDRQLARYLVARVSVPDNRRGPRREAIKTG